jgi:hypothetical protein
MKPILREGDYLISFYDAEDNEVHQQTAPNVATAYDDADMGLADNPAFKSYRIIRCLKNSKYNKWSPNK